MLTVHLRVNDAATGQPTPVRLRISGPDGTYYAPYGRAAEFAWGRNEDVGGNVLVGRDRFTYIDGTCEIKLPAEVPLRVQATKGPEYVPLDEAVTLGPGKMALRFAMHRWSNLRADGWHPGDTRAHFLTPHTAALEATAEDLTVVNLLACSQAYPSLDGTNYQSLPNITAFSGQFPALQTDTAIVAVNTLNVHPVLGSVGLLHAHRVVYPLTFGGDESDDWSICGWCDQCHRKNGLTVWVDPFNPGGEALVALLLGKIDAVEYDGRPRRQPFLPWWYRLLDAGFRVPLVGGSGKDANTTPLGVPRTYARLDPGVPLTYTNWVNAIRAGKCLVTNGPVLRFDANGCQAGDQLDVAETGAPVTLTSTAASLSPFDRLELIANGRVVATAVAKPDGPRWSATVLATQPAERSGWLAARCIGSAGAFLGPNQTVFAHTAPVYLLVSDRPPERPDSALQPLRQLVEQTREWAVQHGHYSVEKFRSNLLARCDEALAALATSETPTA